ncbi:hypothetical protein K0M31_001691 [Melipona bicolor]|uniref:Uncharacterized protein n=1 Tax=Melipona bicolor TaxID=60889 RepID=A0AA40GGA1_9HYME|nr:hypothetical protein K0M31_001691 [Melipona bicolor]
MCNDYYQQNNTQPRILSQQISNKNIYPSISQNNEMIKQPMTQSLQNFEQKQSYVQIDPNLHIPRVSSGRLCSLNQQTSSHYNFNKPLTQTASHFTVPEHINGNISPYTSLNVSQNRFAPMTLDYVRSSNVQPFQQKSNKVLLHDMETQTRCVGVFPNETSSVYTISTPIERNICCMSSLNKSPNLSKQASPRYFDYSWKKPDHFRSRHKSINGTSVVRPLTSGIDNMMRRYKCFTPETNMGLNARQSAVEQDKSRTTTIVENELDRYIDKIRRLHRDLDAQSLEEIEQKCDIGGNNTLDVSLSDDNLSEVPTGDQSKENLPKEVEKILALANDLASRSVNLDVANESGKGRVNKNRSVELIQATKDGTPILERNYVAFSDTRNDRKTSAALAKHEISGDIKLHETKLDSHQNVENSGKENLTLEHYEQKLSKINEQVDFMVPSGDKVVEQDIKNITSKNIQRKEYDEKDRNIYIAAESNLDQYLFDIAEELEPWDLDVLQKRIKEVNLIHEAENQFDKKEIVTDILNQDNVKQTEPLNEMKTTENEENKKDSNENTYGKDVNLDIGLEQKDIECLESKEELVSENEISEISISQDQKDKSYTTNENIVQNIEPAGDQINEQNEFDNELTKHEADEINVTSNIVQGNEQDVQDYEYSNENYYEDSNRAENYAQNYETEYTGLNEGYNYDQNASYENNQHENYDQNMSYNADQEQNYDPSVVYEANQNENYNSNALYDTDQRQNYTPNPSYKTDRDQNYEQNVYENNQNQEYQEYINQEYIQGSSEQYGEYASEQYGSENQYEHENQYDPNVQYQENADQQYTYAYDQQYDSNQENDSNVNQSFAYSDYDPNQAQLVQEKDKPNEELQGEPKHEEAKGKVDTAQSKNETSVSENGKKKKDVIKSLLDSDTDSTIERNVSNTESDFDFN